MSGTKPITHNVVRGFRGQLLYLVSLHANHGFRWVADRKQALALSTPEDALKIAERASREYGAKCTVVDSHEAPHVIERAAPVAHHFSTLKGATRGYELAYPRQAANAWHVDVVQNSFCSTREKAAMLLVDRVANGEAFDGEFVRRWSQS